MFRTWIYPSSGACDYSVELPHWSYCSWFDVCWSFGVAGLEWYPCCRLKHSCNTDTTPTQPHRNCNTHRTKTNVVIQQNSRKLLMMDILVSETCWAHTKWNKIVSDVKLVFYSSNITMMHGPINVGFLNVISQTTFVLCFAFCVVESKFCTLFRASSPYFNLDVRLLLRAVTIIISLVSLTLVLNPPKHFVCDLFSRKPVIGPWCSGQSAHVYCVIGIFCCLLHMHREFLLVYRSC